MPSLPELRNLGTPPTRIQGTERTVIAAIGDERGKYELQQIESMQAVDKVVPILEPYKLSGREYRSERSVIRIGNLEIGGDRIDLDGGTMLR